VTVVDNLSVLSEIFVSGSKVGESYAVLANRAIVYFQHLTLCYSRERISAENALPISDRPRFECLQHQSKVDLPVTIWFSAVF
jgi:hypothetical protein